MQHCREIFSTIIQQGNQLPSLYKSEAQKKHRIDKRRGEGEGKRGADFFFPLPHPNYLPSAFIRPLPSLPPSCCTRLLSKILISKRWKFDEAFRKFSSCHYRVPKFSIKLLISPCPLLLLLLIVFPPISPFLQFTNSFPSAPNANVSKFYFVQPVRH